LFVMNPTIWPRVRPAAIAAFILAASSPSATAFAQQTAVRNQATLPAPKLIVMITVDQLHPGYFQRFGNQLTGGLARLAREGAVFTNAFQDHAITETAPGHASILSGRFPYSTGIVMNAEGVNDDQSPLLNSDTVGASPYRFRGSTLTDWLRTHDSRTRALSVSRKDRGAILPLGRAKQEVYWYGYNGRFTTSTYYHDTLPDWINRYNNRQRVAAFAGRSWTLLLPPDRYSETDSVSVENKGSDFVFPHVLSPDPSRAVKSITEFPWMDELTLEVALEGLTQLKLGLGPQTDVLAISLSSTDAIGHRYGPDSREIHDQILRLDRSLGAFLDSLFILRDRGTIAIALTADHGVAPFPELAAAHGREPSPLVDTRPVIARTIAALVARGVDANAFKIVEGMVIVDRKAFAQRRVNADSVVGEFLSDVRKVPGVLRADRLSVLRTRADDRDTIGRRWRHMVPPDLPVEAVITLQPYATTGRLVIAQHGSAHDYDAHVPIIFFGEWFTQGTYPAMARVVDIAPTFARIANIQPTEHLDGHVLQSALK
jgi:predicted AlkP superfamily pyrophosphatase or phosphodiesterase